MELKVSEKGEVVIPASWRRRLGIKMGDKLKVEAKNGHIILSPQPKKSSLRKFCDGIEGEMRRADGYWRD